MQPLKELTWEELRIINGMCVFTSVEAETEVKTGALTIENKDIAVPGWLRS